MTDDLTQKVAEAISREIQPGWEAAESAARATLDTIIAQGEVTDATISAALFEAVEAGGPQPPYQGTPHHNLDAMAPPIRDLLARAIATACAEKDRHVEGCEGDEVTCPDCWTTVELRAEVERLRHFERVHDGWKRRAERAEAQVQRVRDKAVEIEAEGGYCLSIEWSDYPGDVVVERLADAAHAQVPDGLDVTCVGTPAPDACGVRWVRAALDGGADR